MKILDSMLMHNGLAGITVGIVVVDLEDGEVHVYGTIAAAKSGFDEWRRATGFNMAQGRMEQFRYHAEIDGPTEAMAICNMKYRQGTDLLIDTRTIFKMGNFDGQNLRKEVFGPIRDVVRNVRRKRSIVSVRTKLCKALSIKRSTPFTYASIVDEGHEEGVITPVRSTEAVPVHIASCRASKCVDGDFDIHHGAAKTILSDSSDSDNPFAPG